MSVTARCDWTTQGHCDWTINGTDNSRPEWTLRCPPCLGPFVSCSHGSLSVPPDVSLSPDYLRRWYIYDVLSYLVPLVNSIALNRLSEFLSCAGTIRVLLTQSH